ncbi:MAG: polymer-forming cytoskeletal protein [Anaerolineae bacterium]|nr:polymer-forming cytoskeletal protein [Anaerolineae bacterium]
MSFFSSRRQSDTTPPTLQDGEQSLKLTSHQQLVGFETVLGANCVLEGKLSSKANVRLDGTFTGTLEIEGNVLVGETAKITADIHAKNVSIAGAVHGNVSGKKVQLLRTGRIWGDIQAAALTTEEGAFIDGKITMVSHEATKESDAEVEEQIVEAVVDDASSTDVIDAEVSEMPAETDESDAEAESLADDTDTL